MNKQIEEIKELTNELVFTSNYGTYNAVAEYLHNKGYRKSTDVARESFEELEEFMVDTELYKMPTKSILAEKFAELKKKYESEGADDE